MAYVIVCTVVSAGVKVRVMSCPGYYFFVVDILLDFLALETLTVLTLPVETSDIVCAKNVP